MDTGKENEKKSTARYKFKSLNVYSSDEWMANSTKKYRQVFDRAETTFISAEFAFYNKLFDEGEWEATICIKAFSIVGAKHTELCKLENKRVIKADENIVVYYDGWGMPEPGAFWKKGEYIWEAYIDNELIGTRQFFIEDVGLVTLEKNPYFTVETLKLYPGFFDRLDEDERHYVKKFKRNETPYIWVEFKFRNCTESDYNYEIHFNFYDDAGQPKAGITTLGYVFPNSAGEIIEVSEGWGSNTPGGWKDDKYTVEIVFMDTLVAVVPFEVGDEEVEGVPELFTQQAYQPVDSLKDTASAGTETLEDMMKNLEELIGLSGVKEKIKEHIKYIDFLKLRKDKGFKETGQISLHSVFTGNPGTGKTTVVGLLGKIYNKMGLLSKGHVVEVDRSDLVAPFIGQTAPKVKKAIDDARGGILFIDEAYSLARQGDDEKDFGKEVIEIIIKEMSDGPGDIAIMAAGYPKEMEYFLDSNPGIKSRFNYHFHFDDYLPDELMAIALLACIKRDVKLSEPAKECISKIITEAYRNRDRTFGNARFALSLVDEGKMNLGLRLMNTENAADLDPEVLSTIELEDVEQIVSAQLKKKLDLKVDEEILSASLMELKSLIGMNNIKQEVNDLVKLVRYYRETGKDILNKFSLHSVFTGNPGTGKTTVARIMGRIYKSLGLLERGHVVECDREKLVAGFIGQTAIKTKEMIEKARGGVLFIDEAYALAEGSGNDFGKEAIEVILKNMEDLRGELSVIVAGYPDNMRLFLESNPGLKSRFDKFFQCNDFTADELYEIALGMFARESLNPDKDAVLQLKNYFGEVYSGKDRYFGNARNVRNVTETAIRNQQLRMAGIESSRRTREMMETLMLEDINNLVGTDSNQSSPSIGFKLSEQKKN
jgi:SpoVK/Ycf46/Vps4 family AAA+-type ATPase